MAFHKVYFNGKNMPDALETFRHASLSRCIGLSNLQQPQSLLLFKQTVDGLIFSPFDTLLVSILFSNLSRLVLLNILC